MTRIPTALGSLLAAILAAAVVLGSTTSAEAQKRGGTLTIVRPTDPVSLDPQLETTAPGAWVYFNMLEPLLTMDEKMQIRPALAAAYEVLSPTKVRFKLRPNVKFHDGTPLNAAAVKFTFDRALRGNSAALPSGRGPSSSSSGRPIPTSSSSAIPITGATRRRSIASSSRWCRKRAP